MNKKLLISILILMGQTALARVFDFKMESVAPYLNMQGGLSALGRETYYWQTPDTLIGPSADYLYGGEFGVLFRGGGLGFFTGVKITTIADLEDVQGKNSGSQVLYNVNSSALSYAPLAGFFYQFAESQTSLWNVSLGGGYQWNKIENIYGMTAQGTTDTGLTDFDEVMKQEAIFVVATVGYERHLSGSSTIGFDLGYHYTVPSDWFYGSDGTNFTGSYLRKDKVLLEDGTHKKIDWSYPYFQISLRFYLDVIEHRS